MPNAVLAAVATKKQRKASAPVTRLLALVALLVVAFTPLAPAQTAPGGAPVDPSAPVFYAPPPAAFDPLAASDAELAQYGIPPRPPKAEAVLFADWRKMATTPQVRLTNPTVQATSIINGIARNPHLDGTFGNATDKNSINWSGYAVNAPNGTFAVNNSYTTFLVTVPTVGTENCAYAPRGFFPYIASQWTGFDGAGNSNDVLQAGVSVTACGSPTSYVAWYEWYTFGCSGTSPCSQTNVGLPINANDEVYVDVWYTTSTPNGHAYIWDETSGQSTSIGFNQPVGSPGSGYLGTWVTALSGSSSGHRIAYHFSAGNSATLWTWPTTRLSNRTPPPTTAQATLAQGPVLRVQPSTISP